MQTQQHSEEKDEGKVLKLGPNLTCKKGGHYFVYKTALEIECRKCEIGYVIGPGMNIHEGNITVHGDELVI